MFSSHQLDLVERLCDRVGIVRAGEMVAVGSVEELRTGGADRVEVHAPAAPPGWADGLAGVTTLSREDGRSLLELAEGADDQALLAAALATGPVHEFARRRASLSELFRHVVIRHDRGARRELAPDHLAHRPARDPHADGDPHVQDRHDLDGGGDRRA